MIYLWKITKCVLNGPPTGFVLHTGELIPKRPPFHTQQILIISATFLNNIYHFSPGKYDYLYFCCCVLMYFSHALAK